MDGNHIKCGKVLRTKISKIYVRDTRNKEHGTNDSSYDTSFLEVKETNRERPTIKKVFFTVTSSTCIVRTVHKRHQTRWRQNANGVDETNHPYAPTPTNRRDVSLPVSVRHWVSYRGESETPQPLHETSIQLF